MAGTSLSFEWTCAGLIPFYESAGLVMSLTIINHPAEISFDNIPSAIARREPIG